MSKAFGLAFALLVSVAPAYAGELDFSPHPVEIKETDASRLYRAKWLVAQRKSFARSSLIGEQQSDKSLDALPAELRDKIRRLIALVEEEARSAPGPQVVFYKLRVHCSTRHVVGTSEASARSAPALARPALMWSAVASEPEPTVVRSTVKACSVELAQSRRPIAHVGTMQPYAITLPALTAADK